MKWHFVIVILESDPYPYYSAYVDLINHLKQSWERSSSFRISLLFDSSESSSSTYLYLNHLGSFSNTVPYSPESIHKRVNNFINNSIINNPIQEREQWKTCMLLYVHGNTWFYKHRKQVQTFHQLLDGCKFYFDLFILQSCYTSTLESCLEILPYTSYLITSEYRQSKLFMLDQNIFRLCSSFSSEYDLSLYIMKIYMINLNDLMKNKKWNQEDLVTDLCLLDLSKFDELYLYLKSIGINQTSYDNFKNSKVSPKFDKDLLTYDIIQVLKLEKKLSLQGFPLFQNVIKSYVQSPYLKEKWWSSRLHGLSWSPSPWDNPYVWSYKYTRIFKNHDFFTI